LFAGGAALRQLQAEDPVIGMFPPGTDFTTRTVPMDGPARLLVYSDGAFEIVKADGAVWMHKEFVGFLSGLPGDGAAVIDPLLAHVRQLHGSDMLDDDFSVLDIQF